MTASYSVRVASVEDFRASRTQWNHLVASMRLPTPFGTWEWVYTWWEQFGKQYQSLPLFIYRGQELCGILPLCSGPGNGVGGRLGVAMLEMSGVKDVYPDHLDLIGSPEEAAACLRATLEFLVESGIRWDVLRLPLISQESAILAGVRDVAGDAVDTRVVTVAPYVNGTRTFEDFLGKLSRNERYKLRSRTRKLLEGQNVAYVALPHQERGSALAELLGLHERRAAEKGITSSFARPRVQSFHRALLDRLPPEQVLFRALRRPEDVIAVFYGFRLDNRVFYFQLGHDPAWGPWSPGLVLITETIRESFETGCTEYNFLQGDEPFKRIWAHQARTLYDCHVYNNTVRARVVRALRSAKGRMKGALRGSSKDVGAGQAEL